MRTTESIFARYLRYAGFNNPFETHPTGFVVTNEVRIHLRRAYIYESSTLPSLKMLRRRRPSKV